MCGNAQCSVNIRYGMRLHCNLSEQERTAADVLENGENLTPEQTAYFTAVLAHVDTCREKLNAGDYHKQ